MLATCLKRKSTVACARLLTSGPPENAKVIIVGGGVLGTSVAYNLARLGVQDIVLLEGRSLAPVTSSTYQSTGLVTSSHPVHRFKPILAKSCEQYVQVAQESGEQINFRRNGTLRLATNNQRVDEFKLYTARDYYREDDVCRTTLIGTEEAVKLCPLLDANKIKAALYTIGDGYVDSKGLCRAYAIAAQKRGAHVIESCGAQAIDHKNGKWEIETDLGIIKADHVVNCAGLWARDFGQKTGLDLPILHVEHQFCQTSTLEDLHTVEKMPAIIDHDTPFYLRKSGDSVLFGAFEHFESVVIRDDWTFNGMPADGNVRIEPHFDRIAKQWESAKEIMPILCKAEISQHAGVFVMTPDTNPLIGRHAGLPNYWVAAGAFDGVSSAGGLGAYLAEWIASDEPPSESFDFDVNRFKGWADRKFIVERTRESFNYNYNWTISPHKRLAGRPTSRVSGIYGALMNDGADMDFRSGWEVPSYFHVDDEDERSALAREYQRVTNKCGIVDLSYKGKLEIRGPDAEPFLNHLLTTKIPKFGEIANSLMLTKAGKVHACLKVLHHDAFSLKTKYMLLTDPENEVRDVAWMEKIKDETGHNVSIAPISTYLASIAIIGPGARHVLQDLGKADVSDEGFPANTTKVTRLAGVTCIAVRASATGELGFELFHNRADTLKLYFAMAEAGQKHGLVNFGMKTMNALRLEKGFKLWGREITLDCDPFEAGFEEFVDMSKDNFVGKDACLKLAKEKPTRRLALITVDTVNSKTAKQDLPINHEVIRMEGSDKMIGYVTSGSYSQMLQKPLCYAWLDHAVPNDAKLTVNMREERVRAQILAQPPAQVKKGGS